MPITKQELSGAADGTGVSVVATSSPGTTIHAADASAYDEIYLWANNSSTSPVKLTIEWGGTDDPEDLIEVTLLPENGLELVVPGLILTNSLTVAAFAGTTDVIGIKGYVNRIP